VTDAAAADMALLSLLGDRDGSLWRAKSVHLQKSSPPATRNGVGSIWRAETVHLEDHSPPKTPDPLVFPGSQPDAAAIDFLATDQDGDDYNCDLSAFMAAS
jgi:hypothetical protein